jgi:hypothetical protein
MEGPFRPTNYIQPRVFSAHFILLGSAFPGSAHPELSTSKGQNPVDQSQSGLAATTWARWIRSGSVRRPGGVDTVGTDHWQWSGTT